MSLLKNVSLQLPHVLVLEDDTWFYDIIEAQLNSIGITCEQVDSPHAVFSRMSQRQPDVIVLDLHLPIQNSLSVIHELKSYEDTASLPLIVCSNAITPLIERSLKQYGVQKVLYKDTMHPKDIVDAVKSAITVQLRQFS